MVTLKSVKYGEKRVSLILLSDGAVEKYRMTVPMWESFGFSPGDELSEEAYASLRRAAEMSEAVTAAARIADGSPVSEVGLVRKLSRRGFDRGTAEKAAALLKKGGVLNEERDAGLLAEAAARRKKWGPMRITSELLAKGYPAEVAKAAPYTVPEEEYREALRERISSKFPSGEITEKERAALFASLSRYGFSGGEIRRAADGLLTVRYGDEESD